MRRLLSLLTMLSVVMFLTACGETEQPPPPQAAERAQEERRAAQVPDSAEEIEPLDMRDKVPSVELQDPEGNAVDLARLVAKKPTVIIFYRGGWCPYCTRHLAALAETEEKLTVLGYQILAISPDRPAKLRESREKGKFEYLLLSDSKMKAARAFGIAFKVDEETVKKYEEYGIDLKAASGESHEQLPVPAVFIANTDGVIRFVHTEADYKIRLSPEEVLAAAKEASDTAE